MDKWAHSSVYPITEDDILVVEGLFTDGNTVFHISKSYISFNYGTAFFSTEYPSGGNDFRIVTNFPENLTTLDVRDNPNIRMTIPSYIAYKIRQGLYVLLCDESQDITEE